MSHLLTRRRLALLMTLGLLVSWPMVFAQGADWKPADGTLFTRWAKDVRPDHVLPEYPRPQLVRKEWQNLNGLWQLGFGTAKDLPPLGRNLSDQILVPFPVESSLSGVKKLADRLWYRRTFKVPSAWSGRRVLLHFGAVDWEATVWVNGKEMGTHRGGYDGFSFDVTDALKSGDAREQELIVRVYDPTDASTQPRGKQVRKPGGIFYTPSTGIWQTVWLEPAPETRITSLKIVTDVDNRRVNITPEIAGTTDGLTVSATLLDSDARVGTGQGNAAGSDACHVAFPNDAKLWTPEHPFLYGVKVELKRGDTVVDSVESYAGLRKVEVGKDEQGVNRIKLNGHVVYQVGPLDQGFWPDGLYTAPTDEALKFDIEVTKKLGFNMTRKHVKVEPDRWYYWCDKLGLLVWQDMVAGDEGIGPNDPDLKRTAESARQHEVELKAMIDGLRNHPCIIVWVVFNEGWGQFDTARITNWVKSYDPTRLADCASGWTDRAGVGDLHDLHSYPHPAAPPLEERRAGVLGEFGGLSLGVDGHTWSGKIWGYQGTSSKDDLTRKYERLLREAWDLKNTKGLSAVVYTQLTDVETEANGLLTYDREVVKVDADRVAAVNRGDFSRVPVTRVAVPTSKESGLPWRYTTETPPDDWTKVDFDASSWKEGPGVLGTKGTPGASVRTTWDTPDIWARRAVTLDDVDPTRLMLVALHDEDCQIYLNGVLAAEAKGYVGSYEELTISREALATLKPGKNLIAVHCHQTGGGQAIDVGLIELREPSR